ncbi:DUF2946 family protein [Nitrobacter winogradskyi]|uniref:Uncharacterized protein n=2 Tax=Nitrobacter winogradskyi TaxID=913 RepID=A0ACC6AJA1_NITWI|nr:DUF2946 family protein [Nitrobacter winogradskyi]MCP1999361.1 hypothetical protein [Nitrobacter winogradskyi]GEC14453.1 hypothetical protein NWI01_03450 [Nitrobacter winogradskyi]
MKWFRSNIKHGSRLALFALAIQFVLSFGHHHGAVALAAPAIAIQASDAAGTDKTLATHDASLSDPANASATRPAEPASSQDQDSDHCAVCAVLALARTVLFSAPPVLPLPDAYHVRYLTAAAEFNHLESRRVVFQPRAPPSS